MYRIFFTILVIILAVVSLCFSFMKPEMHKTVLIYNSDYVVVENERQVETKTEPTKTVKLPQTAPVTKQVEEIKYTYPQKSSPKTVTTVQQAQTKVVPQTVATKKVETPKQIQTVVPKTDVVKSVQTVAKKEVQPVQNVAREEKQTQEEIILWNRWRSNLQNQIMSDVKLPIVPVGTIFKFSFDVDKYGRVSNVKTWSLNPNYTPYAIQYIAPVIRSYQGRSILDFPANSNRNSTTMVGGWKISQTAKTSTPDDYRDVEKVVK